MNLIKTVALTLESVLSTYLQRDKLGRFDKKNLPVFVAITGCVILCSPFDGKLKARAATLPVLVPIHNDGTIILAIEINHKIVLVLVLYCTILFYFSVLYCIALYLIPFNCAIMNNLI